MTAAGLAVTGLALMTWRRRHATRPAGQDDLAREAEAAIAANNAKSRYLASISHEIRAPLNSIYGYAQLLERRTEVDPASAGRVIRRSAEHLANLVEGILDMSQVENGVLKLSHDVVAFGPLLDQIASMFRHEADAKGLMLDYRRPERLPEFVRTDQNRLRQVLINLLSNAIKFTPAGTVGFHVRYARQMATFEISDTGPGITAADRDRIFEPFQRGHDAGTQPGAGLGLAITQALVRILGGDLALDSVPGAGSTFRLTMMLAGVADPPAPPAATAIVGGYEGARRAILVVDDDPDQRTMLGTLLGGLGFRVATAARGEEALAIAATTRFDIALVDIAMPGISGWETADRLAAGEEPRPCIIMLSGNAPERHRHDGVQTVHRRFLVKPVAFDSLIEAIGAELRLRWTFAPSAEPAPARPAHRAVPLPPAASVHVGRLRELLDIGHVRGLEAEIKALEGQGEAAAMLARQLYAALDRFDFRAFGDALEPYP